MIRLLRYTTRDLNCRPTILQLNLTMKASQSANRVSNRSKLLAAAIIVEYKAAEDSATEDDDDEPLVRISLVF